MKEKKSYYIKSRKVKEDGRKKYMNCTKSEFDALGNTEWERTTKLDYTLRSLFYAFTPAIGTIVNTVKKEGDEKAEVQKIVNQINWIKRAGNRKTSSSKYNDSKMTGVVRVRRKGRYAKQGLSYAQLLATPLGNYLQEGEIADNITCKGRRAYINANRVELKAHKLDFISQA